MYSIRRKKIVNPDIEMAVRIVDKLNEKFDPRELYHHSTSESELFEFHFKSDNIRREAWEITFLGQTVVAGSDFGLDYTECQEEEYITLEPKNEKKIYILASTNALDLIERFVSLMAVSDISDKNKKRFAKAFENGEVVE